MVGPRWCCFSAVVCHSIVHAILTFWWHHHGVSPLLMSTTALYIAALPHHYNRVLLVLRCLHHHYSRVLLLLWWYRHGILLVLSSAKEMSTAVQCQHTCGVILMFWLYHLNHNYVLLIGTAVTTAVLSLRSGGTGGARTRHPGRCLMLQLATAERPGAPSFTCLWSVWSSRSTGRCRLTSFLVILWLQYLPEYAYCKLVEVPGPLCNTLPINRQGGSDNTSCLAKR